MAFIGETGLFIADASKYGGFLTLCMYKNKNNSNGSFMQIPSTVR
jgi:hypothetical protein